MLEVAHAVPQSHHDELAYALVQTGSIDGMEAAMELDGISAIMRMLLLRKAGKVDEAREEGVQLWFEVNPFADCAHLIDVDKSCSILF